MTHLFTGLATLHQNTIAVEYSFGQKVHMNSYSHKIVYHTKKYIYLHTLLMSSISFIVWNSDHLERTEMTEKS